MVFTNKSYGVATPADKFAQATKKRPVLYFGLPFLLTVVVGSFALSELTATKYNVHDNRTRAVRFSLFSFLFHISSVCSFFYSTFIPWLTCIFFIRLIWIIDDKGRRAEIVLKVEEKAGPAGRVLASAGTGH